MYLRSEKSLEVDIETLADPGPRTSFFDTFVRDLSSVLNVHSSRIQVDDLRGSSVVVDLEALPATDGSAFSPVELENDGVGIWSNWWPISRMGLHNSSTTQSIALLFRIGHAHLCCVRKPTCKLSSLFAKVYNSTNDASSMRCNSPAMPGEPHPARNAAKRRRQLGRPRPRQSNQRR